MAETISESAIEARQRAVLGQPMRVAALTEEQVGDDLRELVLRIAEPLGYEAENRPLTTYFRLIAHHPALFGCQLETGIMYFTKSLLPPRERELAVLRTAWLAGAPYEWGEHVDIGRKLGITPEDTDRVRAGAQAPGWTEHERAVLTAVDELVTDRMISDATWAILAQTYDEAQLIELPALVGQYLGVAMLQNSLRVPLTERNGGFAER